MNIILWTIVIFIIYLIYDFIRNYRKYDLGSKINGPLRFPVIGNVYLYANVKSEGK